MKDKAQRYRPKTGRNESDGKKVTVRLSSEEYEDVRQHAEASGVTPATWLRDRGLKNPHRPRGSLDRDAQREIWRQVAGFGRNCNQIANTANMLQKRGDLDSEAVADLIRRVTQLSMEAKIIVTEVKKLSGSMQS